MFEVKIGNEVVKSYSATAGTAAWRGAHCAAAKNDKSVSLFQGTDLLATVHHVGNNQTRVEYADGRDEAKKRRVARPKIIKTANAEPEKLQDENQEVAQVELTEDEGNYEIKQTPSGKFQIKGADGMYKFIAKNSPKVAAWLEAHAV